LITRMEDGSQLIGKESVNINHIIDEIADELEIMPEEERFTLHTDFPDEVIVEGNLSLIGSIFRNLTENAIAYSGGKNIYISLVENDDKMCKIRFEDDGCGVEEIQLPRLFERFYRIDKGRSRRMGGTGLGLAIVKHAVQFHGGTITANNNPNGGLRFEFTLYK
ncbi:MAG: sensor histidine kinase, partial [Alistipes sp.]|nr:sensor histidine kinase [Alistipes sp.]